MRIRLKMCCLQRHDFCLDEMKCCIYFGVHLRTDKGVIYLGLIMFSRFLAPP